MSKNFTPPEYPLIRTFRTESGFNTSPIRIQLVGNLSPYPVVGGKNSDVLPLTRIKRSHFDSLNEHALKNAFAVCVSAIRTGDGFPTGTTDEQKMANGVVAKHAKEILDTFGRKTESFISRGPAPSGIGASGC